MRYDSVYPEFKFTDQILLRIMNNTEDTGQSCYVGSRHDGMQLVFRNILRGGENYVLPYINQSPPLELQNLAFHRKCILLPEAILQNVLDQGSHQYSQVMEEDHDYFYVEMLFSDSGVDSFLYPQNLRYGGIIKFEFKINSGEYIMKCNQLEYFLGGNHRNYPHRYVRNPLNDIHVATHDLSELRQMMRHHDCWSRAYGMDLPLVERRYNGQHNGWHLANNSQRETPINLERMRECQRQLSAERVSYTERLRRAARAMAIDAAERNQQERQPEGGVFKEISDTPPDHEKTGKTLHADDLDDFFERLDKDIEENKIDD